MDVSFKPYEGREPYIFVSYARKDKERVFPLLNALHEKGYRIWLDEDGIPLGANWMKTIQVHIDRAKVCLVFWSRASATSKHCEAETGEMVAENKNIVTIFLDDTPVTPGLRMYLRQYQSVKLSDFQSDAAFVERLDREPVFDPCKVIPKPINELHIRETPPAPRKEMPPAARKEMPPAARKETIPTPQKRTPPAPPREVPTSTIYNKRVVRAPPHHRRLFIVVVILLLLPLSAAVFWQVTRIKGQPDDETATIGQQSDDETATIGQQPDDETTTVGQQPDDETAIIEWQLDDGVLTISGQGKMENYGYNTNHAPWWDKRSDIFSIIIKDGLSSIGDYAFRDCTNLTKVIIPDSVTKIGVWAFYLCQKLAYVNIPTRATYEEGYSASFPSRTVIVRRTPDEVIATIEWQLDDNGVLTVSGHGKMENYGYNTNHAPWWNKRGEVLSITIKDGISSIGDYAFRDCTNLKSVSIPESVSTIGVWAFRGCDNLTSVEVPAKVSYEESGYSAPFSSNTTVTRRTANSE